MTLRSLPKAELHCHLDGIISPTMIRAIRRDDPAYPLDPVEFEKAYPVNGLDSFFRWWQFFQPINGQIRYFYPIIAQYIAELKAQRVHYFEVMVANGEIPADPAEALDTLAAFREWVNDCEAGEIQVEFLVALNRQNPAEWLQALESKILTLFEAGLIVGVALAGPEIGRPVKPYMRSFARFHDAGVKIEIHAGEWVGAESVWDALEHGYPDRIGHGVTLFDDPRLIEIFQERQIHVEMCPTSNLKTGSIQQIEQHPIVKAKALGLNFGVSTDDPGVFLCSMESEYRLLSEVLGFSEDDLMQMFHRTLAARFQPILRAQPDLPGDKG